MINKIYNNTLEFEEMSLNDIEKSEDISFNNSSNHETFYAALNETITLLTTSYDPSSFDISYTNYSSSENETMYNETHRWWAGLNLTGNRGGGVTNQNGGTDPVLIATDDAAWVLTATFIIFTMQSGQCRC